MSDTIDQADLALRRCDGATALALYERAMADDGDPTGNAAAGRVRALWMLRRWAEARARLAALDHRTDSIHVALTKGVVALGQPDSPVWLTAYVGSARRDDAAAISAFTTAVRLDENCAEAVAGKATALRMSGRRAVAEQVLADAVARLQVSAPILVEQAACAFEQGEFLPAFEYCLRALETDPDYTRAALLQFRLRGQVDQGSAGTLQEVAAFIHRQVIPAAATLELHGWMLYDYMQVLSDPHARHVVVQQAWEQFRQSTEIGPVLPGAICGMAAVQLANDNVSGAMRLVDEAIMREPESPLLHRYRADISSVGSQPEQRIEEYRRVLDLDPRDLRSRVVIVHALIDTGRAREAREILDLLQKDVPGSGEVADAQRRLDAPWQMPASHNIKTRIGYPWVNDRDNPAQVLEILTAEVIDGLGLPPEGAARLRNQLAVDGDAVLEQAFQEEQTYLRNRNEYLERSKRARKGALWRVFGYAFIGFSAVSGLSAMGLFVWLLTSLIELPTGWRLVLSIGLPLLIAGIGVLDDIVVFTVEVLPAIIGTFLVGGPAALVWQGIRWYGVGAGIVAGLGVTAVVLGVAGAGWFLTDRFSTPTEWSAQQAFDEWLENLYGNGLLPMATEASRNLKAAYSTLLPANSRIISDAAVEVDTPATKELRQLLTQRSKGSFALAGPRGVGKSTLLERWCAGHFLREPGVQQQARRDLTIKVDAPVGYESKDFLTHLFSRLCDAVEKYARNNESAIQSPVKRLVEPASRGPLLRRSTPTLLDPSRRSPDQAVTAGDLIRLAAEERGKIRYLMSRTTEGELSIGAPSISRTTIGFKRKVAVRRDDVPLNYPELVDRFRDMLDTAAGVVSRLGGKVLIGIDELDRISDGEAAQRFLNELKAVFNVPNCYFLVSVSEDALADFELSAMGMRTVFDSAFDTIVRVDYLRFEQAKVLLRRRITDLPEQFVALAYVISGGLARELGRTAEAIGGNRSADQQDLASLTAYLVLRQLTRTTRAAMDRLSRSEDRRAGATLIPLLDEHPVDDLAGPLLREYATKVADIGVHGEEPELVARVRLDVTVMVEYLAVLLDVFDNQLDELRMATGRVRGLGDFETLARVRRYLGANPYGARELLHAFEDVWSIGPTAAVANRTR